MHVMQINKLQLILYVYIFLKHVMQINKLQRILCVQNNISIVGPLNVQRRTKYLSLTKASGSELANLPKERTIAQTYSVITSFHEVIFCRP